MPNVPVVVRYRQGLQHEIQAGKHTWLVDEPVSAGGEDTDPDPYSLLLGALGSCTAMTLMLYARRKHWPLEDIRVELTHDRIYARDCQECETQTGQIDQIERHIYIEGPLDAEQLQRLTEIADKCPVHKTLLSETRIVNLVTHELPVSG